jgi:sterol desaturase/sphingolipid hydroxylase (fatty acid hydroxylase superfamily)
MQGYAIRRFSDGVLDAMVRLSRTRANYWLEFVLDTALGATLLSEGLRRHSPPLVEVLLILLGLLAFTFIEYCAHRWLFHGSPQIFAHGHTAHHGNPLGYDSVPFFLPALTLLGFIGLFLLLMPVSAVFLLAGGIACGYVAYGVSHFMIHHMRFRHSLLRSWAAYHHIHHYHPDCNYGVTTPLWDVLLGTRYAPARRLARPRQGSI